MDTSPAVQPPDIVNPTSDLTLGLAKLSVELTGAHRAVNTGDVVALDHLNRHLMAAVRALSAHLETLRSGPTAPMIIDGHGVYDDAPDHVVVVPAAG
jgi:hypothetical protein